MYGLNIDPRNPQGDPDPADLRSLGVEQVRFTFNDFSADSQLAHDVVEFYRRRIKALAQAGIRSLVILNRDTLPNQPAFAAPDRAWADFIAKFANRAAVIAKVLAAWRPAFQIWQTPDQTFSHSQRATILHEVIYGRLLTRTYRAIKQVDARLPVITAGLVSGQPSWLAKVLQTLDGPLPFDAVALHPYAKRPTPAWPGQNWGTGYVGDLLRAYRQVVDQPFWITEIGVDSLDDEGQAAYLRRFYDTISTQFVDDVEQVFWFCYSDGMAQPFGLIDRQSRTKPSYDAYQAVAQAKLVTVERATEAAITLDRLHFFARYLEQNIVFGVNDAALHEQMKLELRGNEQLLSREDIWRLMQRMLAGSSYSISQPEVEALTALQTEKDLYTSLRSIVLATHQRTGALSGRLGVHVRVSAEDEANAATNIEAVMRALTYIESGNRLVVMDLVKATADENKLRAPDVFETNIYGQHRNGLIDNHAWNLQRFVRTIRDRGFQDRLLLIIRLDGPDNGANVNIFRGQSQQKYELAIAKFIRYLETVLPTVPFKIVLGNEPDLPQERQWSDPDVDPRDFALYQFAPAMGNFMKKLASQRPDMTFVAPALSANLKQDQLEYYSAFFGDDRPDNVTCALHGYAADVTTLPAGQQNLVEQQAQELRDQAGFQHISGTEIGSNHPFDDAETLSERAYFDEVVMWLMLSVNHHSPPGQDNNWSFRINPGLDDPAARHLAHVVNRSEARVLRNIQERSGANLQIVRNHSAQRPPYAVAYINHNTPAAMAVGQTGSVILTVRNTSSRTWPAGGPNPLRVGYHWYTLAGQPTPASLWADHRTALPHDLLPDDQVTLTCSLGAPNQIGVYEVRWDMVEERKTWFAWQGVPTLDVQITVGSEPPAPDGLRVRSSHNNVSVGADNLGQAIDDQPQTRWSSRAVQQPGMWFEIELSETQRVSGLKLESSGSPLDYPRGYVVRVSADGNSWQEIARRDQNEGELAVSFSPRLARYLRVEQTGRSDRWWWSIHGVVVDFSETLPELTVRSSHNNVSLGADNLGQAIDDQPQTRWSSRAVQQPGMWFEIGLSETQRVSGLKLESSGSPLDYPRGYVVRVSADGNSWQEIARRDQNEGELAVSFSPRLARYLRVEQTGRSDRWWWSIHGVVVDFSETLPKLTVRSSHNNVGAGADNLGQAIDDQPQTRWSSRAVQQPGMWFEIELSETQRVSRLKLESSGSPLDYPRGYVVQVSTDGNTWQEAARRDQNEGELAVSFSPRLVRYLRVEQTGRSDRWWWSIHGVVVEP